MVSLPSFLPFLNFKLALCKHFGKTNSAFYLKDIFPCPSLGLWNYWSDMEPETFFKMLGQLLYHTWSSIGKWAKGPTHSSDAGEGHLHPTVLSADDPHSLSKNFSYIKQHQHSENQKASWVWKRGYYGSWVRQELWKSEWDPFSWGGVCYSEEWDGRRRESKRSVVNELAIGYRHAIWRPVSYCRLLAHSFTARICSLKKPNLLCSLPYG